VSGRSWAASGRNLDRYAGRPARSSRPPGSWGAAVERARAAWDGLTGGPTVRRAAIGPDGASLPASWVYSDIAAESILATALGLWSDTAASMGGDDEGE
jgi:hypothetical protein